MSEKIENSGTEDNGGSQDPKEDFVSKKAYEEVRNDMLKYKQAKRDYEAELAKIKSDRDAELQAKMVEEERWKELAEKTMKEKEELSTKLTSSQKQMIDFHKKQAVITKLGGLKKSDYASFIDVEKILIDDNGAIDPDSIEAEVNRMKQNHPELINSSLGGSFNNEPAKKANLGPKSVNEMNRNEKISAVASLLRKH